MADDLGGRGLSVYGNQFNETQNIDKSATQGMRFSNAYGAPVCSPTRQFLIKIPIYFEESIF